jgi:hypothetical protein
MFVIMNTHMMRRLACVRETVSARKVIYLSFPVRGDRRRVP